jgi:hypothetical protein
MKKVRNLDRNLVGKAERKRQFEGRRSRWDNNIKMDLSEIRLWLWIGFVWLRLGTGGELL